MQDLTVQVLLLLCCVILPRASIAAALQNLAPSRLGFGGGWKDTGVIILFLQLCVCALHQRELRLPQMALQELGMRNSGALMGHRALGVRGCYHKGYFLDFASSSSRNSIAGDAQKPPEFLEGSI